MWCPSSVPMSNTSCAAATACAKAWVSSPRLPRWKLRAQTLSQQGLIIPRAQGVALGLSLTMGNFPHTIPSQTRRAQWSLSGQTPNWSQQGQIPASTSLPSRAAGSLSCSSRAELPRSQSYGRRPTAVPDANNLHSLFLRCLQQVPAGFQRAPKSHARVGRRDGVSSDPQQHPAQQSHAELRGLGITGL